MVGCWELLDELLDLLELEDGLWLEDEEAELELFVVDSDELELRDEDSSSDWPTADTGRTDTAR